MKVKINRIKLNELHHPDVRADITFSYDDRDNRIHGCQADIDLGKQQMEVLSFEEFEKLAVRQAYHFFEETIANCEKFLRFPFVTIEF